MTRILVTGATGFLGRHVIGGLLEAAAPSVSDSALRILARGSHPWEGDQRLESVPGDITSSEDVRRAVADVGVIVHLAGIVRRDPRDAELMHRTHVGGTRNLCEAAIDAGVRRIVVASTSGTMAVSRTPVVHSESASYALDVTARWPYYGSKIEQEKLALAYAAESGLEVVILNPSILLGPGDVHRSSTDDVRRFLAGKIPNVPSGGFNFVDARDAARAFIRAVDRGRSGQRYLIGGHNVTVREFFGILERVSGVRAPRLVLPEWAARASAAALRAAMRVVGLEFPIDDTSIEMAYRFWYCDSRLAAEELGFHARPAEETIRDTVLFIRNHS